ncbi:MAG TPA: RidA family protein [Bryobacteraceae bacterium]|nr:RidA family protein [Bryobacteraceae bacterium]
MSTSNRRSFITRGGAAAAAVAATAAPAAAQYQPVRKVIYANGKKPAGTPLFNNIVQYGNLIFIAGVGAHEGPKEIKAHTRIVLDQIQKQLETAGSSMNKVLKCNVYLSDIKDWAAMNEVFQGRFGEEPPVRTTIAAAGIPGDSMVEIDVIAYV